jgi:hypothetical protein
VLIALNTGKGRKLARLQSMTLHCPPDRFQTEDLTRRAYGNLLPLRFPCIPRSNGKKLNEEEEKVPDQRRSNIAKISFIYL